MATQTNSIFTDQELGLIVRYSTLMIIVKLAIQQVRQSTDLSTTSASDLEENIGKNTILFLKLAKK